MDSCVVCKAIAEKKLFAVYEDADVVAALAPNPCTIGHLWVIPKKHYTIFEEVPDDIAAKLFSVSNKISNALFESLSSQGTNIIIQNGSATGNTLPHVVLHVISRRENDGLNFQWITKKITEDEMSLAFLQLSEDAKKIVIDKQKKEEVIKPKGIEQKKYDKEDYMIKQLERTP